jgi:exosortase A
MLMTNNVWIQTRLESIKAYQSLYILFIAFGLWGIIYLPTISSMVKVWWISDTFAHGFLIFPIAIYLIYQKRYYFHCTKKSPSLLFMLLLLLTIILWTIAHAVNVLVIQQLMVILMLPLIVGSLYGLALLKHYLFPFFYLFFAVPFGEFLIPKLQEITAMITVFGLELSQIPVFTEGLFISVPSGDFEVAIACSGIRYLIASFALGTLYAYLMYSSYMKRGIFILASLIIPIIANGIRAYGIILIAHLSEMKYATGVDHLIYGWLFFGFVMFILFYLGNFWEDKDSEKSVMVQHIKSKNDIVDYSLINSVFIGIIIILLLGPGYSLWMQSQDLSTITSKLLPQKVTNDWLVIAPIDKQWTPIFHQVDTEIQNHFIYQRNQQIVFVYKNEYLFEEQGKELINTMNQFYDKKQWILIKKEKRVLANMPIIEYDIRAKNSSDHQLLIWGWYEVMGFKLTHPILVKIAQAWGKISSQEFGGRFTAIASPYSDDLHNKEAAQTLLKLFLEQNIIK